MESSRRGREHGTLRQHFPLGTYDPGGRARQACAGAAWGKPKARSLRACLVPSAACRDSSLTHSELGFAARGVSPLRAGRAAVAACLVCPGGPGSGLGASFLHQSQNRGRAGLAGLGWALGSGARPTAWSPRLLSLSPATPKRTYDLLRIYEAGGSDVEFASRQVLPTACVRVRCAAGGAMPRKPWQIRQSAADSPSLQLQLHVATRRPIV